MQGVLFLIINLLSFYSGSQPYDVIVLSHASVKGKFISYNYAGQTIKFYNLVSRDTDIVPVAEVKYLFYNSLTKDSYDTLYQTYATKFTGKIFYQSQAMIVFWDSESKKILSLDPSDYINIRPASNLAKFWIMRNILISFVVFLLIFTLSLFFAKDYVSGTLFGLFAAGMIYLIKQIQKFVKL